ncbi:MAG: signal peptidase II [Pseudomonadota bacterium]
MTQSDRLLGLVALAIFALDRISKIWIVELVGLDQLLRIEVAPPYLVLQMAWNRGINFGIPLGGPEMLAGLAMAISVSLVWWVLRRAREAPQPVLVPAAGVVVGGALGNAFDRLYYPQAAVADFLNMSCCGIDNPFSFNVADIAIFLGAVVIAWKA